MRVEANMFSQVVSSDVMIINFVSYIVFLSVLRRGWQSNSVWSWL